MIGFGPSGGWADTLQVVRRAKFRCYCARLSARFSTVTLRWARLDQTYSVTLAHRTIHPNLIESHTQTRPCAGHSPLQGGFLNLLITDLSHHTTVPPTLPKRALDDDIQTRVYYRLPWAGQPREPHWEAKTSAINANPRVFVPVKLLELLTPHRLVRERCLSSIQGRQT